MKIFKIFTKKKPKTVGQRGEDCAVQFLKKKKYKVLERNFINPRGRALGEIDIITRQKDTIIFIEVKARKYEKNMLPPEMNITPDKMRKVERIALYYLRKRNWEQKSYKFEVVSVIFRGENAEIKHITDVVF